MSGTNHELIPNKVFARPATDEHVARTTQALEANDIHTVVVETGAEARKRVLDLLPEGVEALATMSKTLEKLGITPTSTHRTDMTRYGQKYPPSTGRLRPMRSGFSGRTSGTPWGVFTP